MSASPGFVKAVFVNKRNPGTSIALVSAGEAREMVTVAVAMVADVGSGMDDRVVDVGAR
jgi:hypothetical protein